MSDRSQRPGCFLTLLPVFLLLPALSLLVILR